MADNPSAFPLIDPLTGDVLSHGMTLRDWFAGRFATTLLGMADAESDTTLIPRAAYIFADAMLAARENSNG